MKWMVKFLPEAVNDLRKLDNSIRARVLSVILKLEIDPLNYGLPLGNKLGLDLTAFFKITPSDGYRVVYFVQKNEVLVTIISIGKREKEKVYKNAALRIERLRTMANIELQRLDSLLGN